VRIYAVFLVFFLKTVSAYAFWAGVNDTHLQPNQCLLCHGNQSASFDPKSFLPPELPRQFTMDWTMFEFESSQRPPFATLPPHTFITGKTFYDWDSKSMTESYPEKCIDIFSEGRDYPCQFTSVKDKTYLIKFRKDAPDQVDSCCKWTNSGFWAPRPDVVRNMTFDQSLTFSGKQSNWWDLIIPLPGPFGYGMFGNTNVPAAFWFPVISGWVQQDFSHFTPSKPDPKYFELPPSCEAAPVCADSQ
jgi:hypothetical protein